MFIDSIFIKKSSFVEIKISTQREKSDGRLGWIELDFLLLP
jgi:hypothetical protein